MDHDLLKRYRAFRGRTGIVGRDAVAALALARAEQRAEAIGFQVVAEPEEESYESVYGETPPAGVEFFWVAIYPPDVNPHAHKAGPLASLGFVDDADPVYWHKTVAELYIEALDLWDTQRDIEATTDAAELAARPSFAMNV